MREVTERERGAEAASDQVDLIAFFARRADGVDHGADVVDRELSAMPCESSVCAAR